MTASDPERDPSDLGRGMFENNMGPGSSFAHLYRGEVHRMKLWRERLDRTTNWAVIVLAAILTWAFSTPDHPHYLLIVGGASLTIFLGIEARRYRGYDIWRSRVRYMQENVVAVGLDPEKDPVDREWRTKLSDDYREPTVKITWGEALAHRLRRIYLPLYTVMLGAWIIRVTAFFHATWPSSAAIGQISGEVITAFVAFSYATLVFMTFRPRTWRAKGELTATSIRSKE